MSGSVVRLEHVTKRYGPVTAVDDLDMSIGRGEFVTFLGPSGCGKSTTLRMLGGFEQPDEGRVFLGGEDVTMLPPNRRRVNMVFQDYALFPHLSVARNIAFGLEMKGFERSAIERRVDEMMGLVELEGLRDRRPDQLSGGQRQRVALARALALDPELLLLDEPLGALDAKLRAQLQRELKEIQRRTGTTFFFVTHDQDEALTMSDRIVVMNAGRVEQDGTPEELYARPVSRFVAEFVGETNLIEGSVRGTHARGDAWEVALDWSGRVLRAVADWRPQVGDPLTVALRPEAVRLHAERPADAADVDAVPATVVERVFKGSRSVIDIAVGGEGDAPVLRAYVGSGERPRDALWASWSPADVAPLRS